jgi:hypothetical protein
MKKYSFRKAFVVILVIYAIGCIFFGCSPEKRLNRILLKHPDLLKEKSTTVKDTFIRQDTIFIPSKKDSFIIITDTIIRTKNFEVQKIGSWFIVSTLTDTIIKHDTTFIITTKTEKINAKKNGDFRRFVIAFIVLLIATVVLFIIVIVLGKILKLRF